MSYQNMNESLLKSFDNIMHQQTKMDHKSYIFLGFLVVIFNAVNRENTLEWTYFNTWLVILAIPLLISLFPIASKFLVKIVNQIQAHKLIQEKNHNIFYYLDIYNLDQNQFKTILKNQYGISDYSKSDIMLIDQIIINAKILNVKVFWHSIFQTFLLFLFLLYWISPLVCKYVIPFIYKLK